MKGGKMGKKGWQGKKLANGKLTSKTTTVK